jgi:hypothetical protein
MVIYVDEVAVAMAIIKIHTAEGGGWITARAIMSATKFTGKGDTIKKKITELLKGWEDMKILVSHKIPNGVRYTVTEDIGWGELQKIRGQKAPWLAEAEELVETYGHILDINWEYLLEKAASKQQHRAWFQKVYLPWLRNDNYYLLEPEDEECEEQLSINRLGNRRKLIPSCGFFEES